MEQFVFIRPVLRRSACQDVYSFGKLRQRICCGAESVRTDWEGALPCVRSPDRRPFSLRSCNLRLQASVSCHREARLQQIDAIVQPDHTINSSLAGPGPNLRFLSIALPLLGIAI